MIDPIVSLSESVYRAQERVNALKKNAQHISEFNGTGYCSVSLSSKQRSVCIDFGQLMEMYDDHLADALTKIIDKKIEQAEAELDKVIKTLQDACKPAYDLQDQPLPSPRPWYPDLPGWTWYEHTPGTESDLSGCTLVQVLYGFERTGMNWENGSDRVDRWWGWDATDSSGIVAYATKNV